MKGNRWRVRSIMQSMRLLSWVLVFSGTATSERVLTIEKDFKDFNRLQFSHAFHFEVRQGQEYSTVIRISEQAEKRLLAVQRGTTVSIGLTPGPRIRLNKPVLKALVILPDVVSLHLSGACQGKIIGFTSDAERTIHLDGASSLGGEIKGSDLYFGVSGASALALGCTSRHTQVKLSGAGRITLKGRGGNLTVQATGASRVDLSHLRADDVKVILAGASQAEVRVKGRLDIHASGASSVRYKGEAILGKLELSGASKVSGEPMKETAGAH